MRQFILICLGLAMVIGAFFVAKYTINSNKKETPKAAKVVTSIFAETVENTTVPIIIPANGTLMAKNRLELYSETQGLFQSSANDFKAGQTYTKGQTLLNINSAEFYATLQASKSDFLNLVTSLLPDLRLDYPEAFPLWENYVRQFDVNKSIAPLPEITSEKVTYFITGRGVQGAYYNVKNLEQRLSKFRITAPYTGVLTEALVTKGTLIRAGQKLGEFIDPSVFELELAIPKEYIDLLKQGQTVTLSAMDTNASYTGIVTRINEKIDQATQTVTLFVTVKGEGLREGMYLEAQLTAREEQNAIKIARQLMLDENKIYVVRDSILDVIDVNPVYFSEKEVVLKGVPDGTTILSKAVPGAYAGMLVKAIKNTPAPSANSQTTTE